MAGRACFSAHNPRTSARSKAYPHQRSSRARHARTRGRPDVAAPAVACHAAAVVAQMEQGQMKHRAGKAAARASNAHTTHTACSITSSESRTGPAENREALRVRDGRWELRASSLGAGQGPLCEQRDGLTLWAQRVNASMQLRRLGGGRRQGPAVSWMQTCQRKLPSRTQPPGES